MKIKLVQDSIIFISGLTKTELDEATRFCPASLTLKVRDEATKKETPICAVCYAEEGSVSNNGVVFDSTTEDGFMCKTLIASQGNDEHISAEEKVKAITEEFASLILKMNDLEMQIKAALEDNAAKITAARDSVEVVSL
jgi:hypothetical protein